MDWVSESVVKLLNTIINNILGWLGDAIGTIFSTIAELNLNNDYVTGSVTFVEGLAITLVIFLSVKKYFTTYVIETEGDPDADPLDIILRATQATAFIVSNSTLYEWFLKFSKDFAQEFYDSTEVSVSISAALTGLLANSQVGFGTTIYVFTILIGIIIFTIVAGIRGAELGLMKILFPLFAIDLLSAARERWNAFFTTYMIIFFSYALQLFCWKQFLGNFTTVADSADGGLTALPVQGLYALGWMVMMIKTPQWLEKFTYSTGIGNGVKGVIRTVAGSVVNKS